MTFQYMSVMFKDLIRVTGVSFTPDIHHSLLGILQTLSTIYLEILS